jgi:ribose-phosphate pyrophosphokinase
VGSIKIARAYAKDFGADFVVIDKHRHPNGEIDMRLIGNVEGKNVVLTDDICSTANTLTMAAALCKKMGAKRIIACVTHALLVEGAVDRISASPIETLFYTDTIPCVATHQKFKSISVATLLADGIRAVISY